MVRPALVIIAIVWASSVACMSALGASWSTDQIEQLRDLWIGELEATPADRSNRVADHPAAAALGERLFFDTRLSATGTVSCGTCHQPDREFQDDRALAVGVGVTSRRTMPVAGTAHSPFLFWDGRKDSQWAQALGPLESPVEHGGTRAQYALVVAEHYRADYEAIFGEIPDLTDIPRVAGPVDDPAASSAWLALTDMQRDDVTAVFVSIGKAIAAYERRIQYGPSRFDAYVAGLLKSGRAPQGTLTSDEIAGLRLFIGRANCTQCHNGPLFSNQDFHNTGVPAVATLPADTGRAAGAKAVIGDEFNCRSRWSDVPAGSCKELEFLSVDDHDDVRAFKVPSLRNVADRAPYLHAGQFASLAETLRHYNRAPAAPAGHTELTPLRLSARELGQIEAFLRSLSGGTMLAPASR
jgi:cytochrome c peroxidase